MVELLEGFKFICHFLDHSWIVRRVVSIALSIVPSIFRVNFTSSANSLQLTGSFTRSTMSFTKAMNRRGPIWLPWTPPLETGTYSEWWPSYYDTLRSVIQETFYPGKQFVAKSITVKFVEQFIMGHRVKCFWKIQVNYINRFPVRQFQNPVLEWFQQLQTCWPLGNKSMLLIRYQTVIEHVIQHSVCLQ